MKDFMKLISDELYILLEWTMKQYNLSNSSLNRQAKIEIKDNFFLLIFPDYVEYVNYGRKPNAKMPPTDAIIKWARLKGISTDNNTIWAIRQGIKRSGIKARPVLDLLFKESEERWMTKWADQVFEIIIEELTKWFSK